MFINKVINNNIVVVLDKDEKEIIFMGRGIGFKKHPGDTLNPDDIQKKFTLSTSVKMEQVIQLFDEIPNCELEAAFSIVEMATLQLGKRLNESAIISLSDHIHTSIERSKDSVFVKNILLWEIKKFYPDEYTAGKAALQIIEQNTEVLLPEDEAGFIALHIVNAQMDESVGDMYGLTKIIQEIVNIVKYTCNLSFNEESVYYFRFITHLKFFAQRLLKKETFEENENDTLLSFVKNQYQKAYHCVEKIQMFILTNYSYALSEEEQLYLTIHIQRIITKSQQSNFD